MAHCFPFFPGLSRLPDFMRPLRTVALAACSLFLASSVARAAEVRVVSSDARGVTLTLDVTDWRLDPTGVGERLLPFVDGLERSGLTGRPRLPFGRALLALPPGARPIARVVSGGAIETREGVHLAIAARSRLVPDEKFGFIPVLEDTVPIRDGPWPPQPFSVGDPSSMRDRRIVAVELYPFQYDEASARLTLTHQLTVRVDFVGTSAPGPTIGTLPETPDAHEEALFGSQIANWKDARSWRAARPRFTEGALFGRRAGAARALGTGTWDENAPEVRVRIDTTGVYELDYDTLAVYGYPAGTPIAEVSVHRHEYLENASPPYMTVELPIEVDDFNNNGVFDSGDRIVLWVWDWAQRSRASQALRCWGDAEVIYATAKPGGSGARIAHRNAWLGRNDLTPLTSYPWRQRYKQNLQYMTFPPDTVVDPYLWTNVSIYTAPDAFPFETNNLDAAQPASFTVNWMGVGGTPHINWATVTNRLGQVSSVVDSVVWSGLVYFPVTGNVPAGALTEGPTNTLKVWGKTDNTPSGNNVGLSGVHSFDLTYWRGYVPLRGYLSCNSGTQSSDYEIRAGPFSDAPSVRAYDVTDSLNPVRLDNVTFETVGFSVYLHLQDPAPPARRQYVIEELPRLPAPGAFARVTRYGVFNQTSGDYLIIAPEGFVSAAQPLATLHANQGLQVVMAPLEGVYDEFNGGRRSPYAIKRFIRYAYIRWNAKYVLLVGDGSEDPQRFMPTSSPDIVPVQRVLGPVAAFLPSGDYLREAIPGDSWYAFCLTCTDPSASNPLLDVSLGRLPAGTVADVTAMVNKIVHYDDLSGDQTWRRNMLFTSDDQFSGATTFGGGSSGNSYCRHPEEGAFRAINEIADSLVLKTAGLSQTNLELFNLSYYLPNRPGDFCTSCPSDTCRLSQTTFQSRARLTATPALFSKLNAGQMWWNYQGHANEYVMSHESFYLNQAPNYDHLQFQNDGKPCLFSAFSCHGNSFARIRGGTNDGTFGPCFGEAMVTLPNRGAIASFASAGFELIPSDPTRHMQVHMTKAMFVNPPRDEQLGDRGARGVLGEILQATYLANFSAHFSSPLEQGVAISYNLLGDPATRLSLGPPQSVVTANALPVVSGQDIRLHTAGDTLRLEADLVSNVRLDSLSLVRTGPGNLTNVIWRSVNPPPAGLLVSPAFPDTAKSAAVTGGRRFHLTLSDTLLADTYKYSFRSVDRYGQLTNFDADFGFTTVLQVGGQTVADGDIVSPTAALTMLVRSPRPLNPLTDLTLTANGVPQPFGAGAANGDPSGREWLLSWTHAPYSADVTTLQISAEGGATQYHSFRVAGAGSGIRLDNAMVFPNPFDDDYLRALNPGRDVATVFSFNLVSPSPADVTLRVYTISGRLIYQRTEPGLDASYHQMEWNGLDAEGSPLANGIYFYKLLARSGSQTTSVAGRLVKLRRPHHID